MSQEITDAMLDEQAKELTIRYLADLKNDPRDAPKCHFDAIRTALEVDRESLRIIEGCPHYGSCRAAHNHIDNTRHPCTCGLDAHKQVLRTRLGINPE